MAIIDFSKSFDKVPHQVSYISWDIMAWLTLPLPGLVNSSPVDLSKWCRWSDVVTISCIIRSTTGYSFGSLLFLLIINDIVDDINSTMRLFAYNCLLYGEITTPKDNIMMQWDLDTLHQWSERWQMALNTMQVLHNLSHPNQEKHHPAPMYHEWECTQYDQLHHLPGCGAK